MELLEFIAASREIVSQLNAKVAAQEALRPQADMIRLNCDAGEWQLAMEELVALLAVHRIPVTEQEKQELDRLFTHLSQSQSAEVRSRAQESLEDLSTVVTV